MYQYSSNDNLSALDFVKGDYLRELQLARLRKIVRHAYDHVELFRKRMDERKLTPDSIRTLGDLGKLPFMVKADLRDTYPFGLFAEPLDKIVRLHASSGTTGKPIVVAYTKADLEIWQEVMKRSMASCGLSNRDIVQVSYGYGLFTGGLGAHYGAESLGATVVPASGGNTKRQVMLIRDFGTGIPADKLPKIFDSFYTTKKGPDESGKGGTGLGLSLCKRIIERHHGKVRVESSLGKGTAFTLRFPALPAQEQPRE